MLKQRIFLILTAAFMFLAMPVLSYAQSDYTGVSNWSEGRREFYDTNSLKRSASRVDKLSGQLKDDMDAALDRSRLDGKSREDKVNEIVHEFHEAASQFRDKLDSGRDLERASDEARRVVELGWQLDKIISNNDFGSKVESKWSTIREGLMVIEYAYNGNSD